MSISLPLEEMSVEEKLRVMESLWDDLCDTAGSTLSPDWHGTVLAHRNSELRAEEAGVSDWETAKQGISDEIS